MAEITAQNYLDAINKLGKKLSKFIPRIALISQSYIEYILEPFLIYKTGADMAFLRYTADVHGGGLMFMEKEQKALIKLLTAKEIPDTFYYYWNDAVNATGYSSKLLMMFSALEAFARIRDKKIFKKPIDLYSEILGTELSLEIFDNRKGLRNRLVHGEYFKNDDHKKNYLDVIHNKVISYFNNKILHESLIQENIVHPQRHFFGNKEGDNLFLKHKDGTKSFELKDLLNNFSDGRFHSDGKYEIVYDKQLSANY